MGAAELSWRPRERRCRLDESLSNHGDRPHYVTGRLDAVTGRFRPMGIQQSHAIGALAGANGMLRIEAEGQAMAGDEVLVYEL
jgi:molybdopterin molybdotransferase